jgi:hypothetical protein
MTELEHTTTVQARKFLGTAIDILEKLPLHIRHDSPEWSSSPQQKCKLAGHRRYPSCRRAGARAYL